MIDSLLPFLDDLRRHIRIIDLVDILLMSVIVYSVLLWFQATASRRVLVGFAVLLGIYFAARTFGMHLTSMVFHAWFTVLIIVIVVVFQEDLRRMFERVAEWGMRNRRTRSPRRKLPFNVDEFVEVVFALAAAKTGALIVFKGHEDLRRHMNGGVPLEGQISPPLLFSIFDSGSAGHDGAAIIRGGRIAEFGAHLPISKNHDEIAGRGTRHAAALGLSEHCDALIVVVSEERGVVSTAERGKLVEMAEGTALVDRLEAFYDAKYPQSDAAKWQSMLTRHATLKLSALFLTLLAWFVLAYDPAIVQRNLVLPIEYRNIPEGLQLGTTAPDEAQVTLSGYEGSFRYLESDSMAISIDLGSVREPGVEWVTITAQHLSLPPKMKMDEVMPGALRLELRRKTVGASMVQRSFDIPIEYRNVPKGMQLGASAPSASHVKLSGPERQFRLLDPKSMVIAIDLSEVAQEGTHWMPIGEKTLSLPSDLTIDEADPQWLRLELLELQPPADGKRG